MVIIQDMKDFKVISLVQTNWEDFSLVAICWREEVLENLLLERSFSVRVLSLGSWIFVEKRRFFKL